MDSDGQTVDEFGSVTLQVWPVCKDNRNTGHKPAAQKTVSLCHWSISTLTSKLNNVESKKKKHKEEAHNMEPETHNTGWYFWK